MNFTYQTIASECKFKSTQMRLGERCNSIPYTTYFLALTLASREFDIYLRQVNEVNGGDNAFVRCVSVCLCVCVHVRSSRSWELNANSSKTVKATDLKFDKSVPRESPDMTPKIFPKGGVARVT